MADGQQMKPALGEVEVVNHPVIADPDAVGLHPFHPVVWMLVQSLPQTINHRLNSGLEIGWQFEEIRVEIAGVDLQRSLQWPPSGWRVRE